jgi:hypothetical protein
MADNPGYQHPSSVLTERGGSAAGRGGQFGKNYMEYSAGGAYDDDHYSMYAPANYGSNGGMQILPSGSNPRFPPNPEMPPEQEEVEKEIPRQGASVDRPHSGFSGVSGGPGVSSSAKKGFQVLNHPPVKTNMPSADPRNHYLCPECGSLAVRICGCQYRDAQCTNNHSWFSIGGHKYPGISPNHVSQRQVA